MLVVVCEFYVANDEESMKKRLPCVRDLYALMPALSVDRQHSIVLQLFWQEVFMLFGKNFPVIPKVFLSLFIGIG